MKGGDKHEADAAHRYKVMTSSRRAAGSYNFLKNIGLVIGLALPVVAIIWRILYRGDHYVGWEILGAADGQFRLYTETLLQTAKDQFWQSRHYQYSASSYLFACSGIPALIAQVVQSEGTSQFCALVYFCATFFLIAKAFELQGRQYMWIALAVGCSSALLSFSLIILYPVQGLPHAMALWIVMSPRLRRSWLASLILGLLTIEFSFHIYELGRTFGVIFILALIFDREAPWQTRLAWLITGTLQSVELAYLFLSCGGGEAGVFVSKLPSLRGELSSVARLVFGAVFVDGKLDLRMLPILGLLLAPFVRKGRWIILSGLLFQWLLLFILVLRGVEHLRPRRFVMVEIYNIAVIAAFVRDWSVPALERRHAKIVLGALFVLLCVGNITQYHDLWMFTRVPVSMRDVPLPALQSRGDFMVKTERLAWADAICQYVRGGNKILLAYGFEAQPENSTDPTCLPERLYLRLGHEMFIRHIFIFDDRQERYSRVPMHYMKELPSFLKSISTNKTDRWIILKYKDGRSPAFRRKADAVMAAIQARFVLRPFATFDPSWSCFEFLAAHARHPPLVIGTAGSLVTAVRRIPGPRIQTWRVPREDVEPGRYELSMQHAAAGQAGSFQLIAFADTNDDGRPDREIGRSDLKTARSPGEWSTWQFDAPAGALCVGNSWGPWTALLYYQMGPPVPEGYIVLGVDNLYSCSSNEVPGTAVAMRFTNIRLRRLDTH